jgi:hypothetical protein
MTEPLYLQIVGWAAATVAVCIAAFVIVFMIHFVLSYLKEKRWRI